MRNPLPAPVQLLRVFGPLVMAGLLGACTLLIPENPSTPRYNSVLGPPRAPQKNPGGSPGADLSPRPTAPVVQQATAFPPVDSATQVRAQEILAADVPPPVGMADMGRRMPSENQGDAMQMAASDYPSLHSVPPAPPTGTPDSDAARLARIRAQLEADQRAADAAKARLATDAAAEPSLLNTPPIQPVPGPQSMSRPAAGGSIALPPPPPPLAQAGGTAWDRNPAMAGSPPPSFAAAPMSAPAMEPIVLRPPSAAASPGLGYASPAPAAAPAPAMAPAMAGGFNPMAGTEPITLRPPTSYAGGTAYLPNSRYSTRRN